MKVTEEGISIDCSVLHTPNAPLPISITVLGIIVFWHPISSLLVAVSMIALQLLRLSYIGFPDSTDNFVIGDPSTIFAWLYSA